MFLDIYSASAEVWTSNNISAASSAISADGRVFVAADEGTFVSYDYGATWHSNNFFGAAVAVSANGSNIMVAGAVPNQTWISRDSGTNWTSFPAPNSATARQLACSSDAVRAAMVVFGSNSVFISTNGGIDWTTNNDAPVASWTGIACSADGHRLLASSLATGLWLSTNSGLNWSSVLGSNNLSGVACSADGKTVVVSATDDVVYVSRDAGGTWTWQHVTIHGGSGAACSADGCFLGAISYAGAFISTNSGLTWTTQTGGGTVLDTIATSADGQRWITGHKGGQGRLYVGSSLPAPFLKIVPAEGNVSISWTVPSSPFTLEQNQNGLNPLSWSAVTNNPSLNLSTLRNEITVPASNDSKFFRLSGQ